MTLDHFMIRKARVFSVCVTLALSLGCGPKKMDLSPVDAGPDVSAFCQIDEKGLLVISIQNKGKGAVNATTTLLQFGTGPRIVLPTRPIAVGAIETVRFPIPNECRSEGCQFKVLLDGRNEVVETNESNNVVFGKCPAGP